MVMVFAADRIATLTAGLFGRGLPTKVASSGFQGAV